MSNNESFLQAQITGQQLLNTQLQNRITAQIGTISQLQISNLNLQKENTRLSQENLKLKNEILRKNGLPEVTEKPIFEDETDYKKAFEEQQLLLASWMVSQKAFKELSIELGKKQGLSSKEIIELGLNKKIDVLESKHNPEHNTNANNSSIIKPFIERLKTYD